MFLQRLLINAIGVAAIVATPLVVAADAQSQHHGWHHGGPMYDTRVDDPRRPRTMRVGSLLVTANVVGAPVGGEFLIRPGIH